MKERISAARPLAPLVRGVSREKRDRGSVLFKDYTPLVCPSGIQPPQGGGQGGYAAAEYSGYLVFF